MSVMAARGGGITMKIRGLTEGVASDDGARPAIRAASTPGRDKGTEGECGFRRRTGCRARATGDG